MEDVVIISGVRTAIAKFQGALQDFSAPQLGAIAVREAVKRAKVVSRPGGGASWACGGRGASARPGAAGRAERRTSDTVAR